MLNGYEPSTPYDVKSLYLIEQLKPLIDFLIQENGLMSPDGVCTMSVGSSGTR